MCSCVLLVVTKASAEDAAILNELVYSVELSNATRYGGTIEAEPTAPPPVPTPMNPTEFFDALNDPFFDEDVFMGTEELDPTMPLGDHCWIIDLFNICSPYILYGPVSFRHPPTIRPP